MDIKFGTDGWRAIVGGEYTFENVSYCAQGTALLMKDQGLDDRGLVVGYDTRFSSEDFAAAVAEVASGNGIKTYLAACSAPTPVISYNIVAREAGGGAVITASHNASQWNGYKYKPHYGGSASPEIVSELEAHIGRIKSLCEVKRLNLKDAIREGLVQEFDPRPLYFRHMNNMVDVEGIRKAGLRVVVDSMHGAGSGYLDGLVSGDLTELVELRGERNPAFPGMLQPEPVEQNLSALMSTVRERGADVGLATDGDADRLGVVDERGNYVTTLEVFALLCLYQLEVLGRRGPLIRSITMTTMVDRLGKKYGVPVFDTPVGFKYLGPVMIAEDALLAGEESGGYAFRGNIPERDGILSGLMLLDMIVKTGKSLSELLLVLEESVGPHHYRRSDIAFDPGQREVMRSRLGDVHPSSLGGKLVVREDDRDGFRYELEGGYWVLVRFSGTEPLLRVYAEAESPGSADKLLSDVIALAEL